MVVPFIVHIYLRRGKRTRGVSFISPEDSSLEQIARCFVPPEYNKEAESGYEDRTSDLLAGW